jgi:hypothetical protein
MSRVRLRDGRSDEAPLCVKDMAAGRGIVYGGLKSVIAKQMALRICEPMS